MRSFILLGLLALAVGGGYAKVTNAPSCYRLSNGGMWEKGSDGFMYRYSVEPKPFSEAQATCVKWGGNLVMEKTPETRVYVSKSYNARNIWCGVKKDLKRKGFVYVDGGKIKKSYWRKGGPGKQACVRFSGPNNRWMTSSCAEKRAFLCQKKN